MSIYLKTRIFDIFQVLIVFSIDDCLRYNKLETVDWFGAQYITHREPFLQIHVHFLGVWNFRIFTLMELAELCRTFITLDITAMNELLKISLKSLESSLELSLGFNSSITIRNSWQASIIISKATGCTKVPKRLHTVTRCHTSFHKGCTGLQADVVVHTTLHWHCYTWFGCIKVRSHKDAQKLLLRCTRVAHSC